MSASTGEAVKGAWVSNATVADVARRLRAAKTVAVLTHAKPDGDAVGGTLALARALERAGARATCVYPAPCFGVFDSFIGATPVVLPPLGEAAASAHLRAALPTPDAVAIVDTGSWAQVADARAWLEPMRERAVVIDHHPTGDAEIASLRLIRTSAAAVAEIVADVCVALLGVRGASELPAEIAEPLYLGLATDTGFFRYSSVTPATLRLAADLMEAGADHNRVYETAEQSDKPARLRLLGRVFSNVELHAGDRLAALTIQLEDLRASGADLEDAGHLTDTMLAVRSVRAVAVLTEVEGGIVKVSLRSKPPSPVAPRAVDVNAVARSLGGGGHVRAAGAKLRAGVADAKRQVIEALTKALG